MFILQISPFPNKIDNFLCWLITNLRWGFCKQKKTALKLNGKKNRSNGNWYFLTNFGPVYLRNCKKPFHVQKQKTPSSAHWGLLLRNGNVYNPLNYLNPYSAPRAFVLINSEGLFYKIKLFHINSCVYRRTPTTDS